MCSICGTTKCQLLMSLSAIVIKQYLIMAINKWFWKKILVKDELLIQYIMLFRGSLYRIIHRPHFQIDERQRIKMALDVVRFNIIFTWSILLDLRTNWSAYFCLCWSLMFSYCRQRAWIAYIQATLQLFTVIWSHLIFWLIRTGMLR